MSAIGPVEHGRVVTAGATYILRSDRSWEVRHANGTLDPALARTLQVRYGDGPGWSPADGEPGRLVLALLAELLDGRVETPPRPFPVPPGTIY